MVNANILRNPSTSLFSRLKVRAKVSKVYAYSLSLAFLEAGESRQN